MPASRLHLSGLPKLHFYTIHDQLSKVPGANHSKPSSKHWCSLPPAQEQINKYTSFIFAGKIAGIGSRLNLELMEENSVWRKRYARNASYRKRWLINNRKKLISYDWGSYLNIHSFCYFPERALANSSNHLHRLMAVYCKVSIKVKCFTGWPLVFLLLKNNRKWTFKGYILR